MKLWELVQVSEIEKIIVYDPKTHRTETKENHGEIINEFTNFEVLNVFADLVQSDKSTADCSISIKPVLCAMIWKQ